LKSSTAIMTFLLWPDSVQQCLSTHCHDDRLLSTDWYHTLPIVLKVWNQALSVKLILPKSPVVTRVSCPIATPVLKAVPIP